MEAPSPRVTSLRADSRRQSGSVAAVARAGAIAGIVAGMMMAMYQMVVGAIASEPTAAPGIDTSFWTPVTAIPSVPFGEQWLHGSFDFWAVVLGLGGHMMNAVVLGVIGVALLVAVLGRRPGIAAAMALGMAFGIAVEAVLVNLVINNIQDVDTFYTSTPEWSWWAAHAMFGAVLGLVAASLLRRGDA